MVLDEVIAKLEAADKGSRDFDAAIWLATRVRWNQTNFYHWRHMLPKGDPGGTEEAYAAERAPSFTSSLDAALMLVKGGFSLHKFDTGVGCQAHVGEEIGDAKTPALSICVAALKVRKQDKP